MLRGLPLNLGFLLVKHTSIEYFAFFRSGFMKFKV
jgi:hypothetical protein